MSSSNLDILRAIAVGAVLLAHLFRFFGNEHLGPFSAWELGISGVLMFFVHTALVLMMLMERMSLANVTDRQRFMSVVPPAYTAFSGEGPGCCLPSNSD